MKYSDDYSAKLRLWEENPKVMKMPKPFSMLGFHPMKFNSWDAFNSWKKQYLLQIAKSGGIKWTN